MKAIIVNHTADGTLEAALGADSALLRPSEPVFVADPPQAWRCRVIPAVRISRLGLNIAAANAHRHYDAFSAYLVTTPDNPIPGIPDGLIDRTFSPGKALPADADSYDSAHRLDVVVSRIGGDIIAESSVSFSLASLRADETIARLSQWCTFRTGDIILFADVAADLGTPMLNTVLTAAIDGDTVLNVRIK